MTTEEHHEQSDAPLRPWWRCPAALLAIAAHVALSCGLAWHLNIWIDEAYTLHTTAGGVSHAMQQALYFELQPPLYFMILSVWRFLGDSAFVARLFSILCSTSTLVVALPLSRRYLKDVRPEFVLVALALNPMLIWAAVEIRLYAFAILLSGLLLLFFYDGFLAEKSSRAARCWYGGIAVIALYTQYYLGFILATNAIVLLLFRRGRALRSYLLVMIAVGVCSCPIMVFLPHQLSLHSGERFEPAIASALLMPFLRLWRYVFVTYRGGGWGRLPANALLLVSVLAVSVAVLRDRKRFSTRQNLLLWTITGLAALSFSFVLMVVRPENVEARHTVLLLLPATLSAFAVAYAVGGGLAVKVATLAMLCFSSAILGAKYARPAKEGDWHRVVAHVMNAERAGDPIVVFSDIAAVCFEYYYRGCNVVVPIPRPEDFAISSTTCYLADSALQDEEEIEKALHAWQGQPEQMWLVSSHVSGSLGVGLNRRILEDYVRTRYRVVHSAGFHGTKVRLLRLKRPDEGPWPSKPQQPPDSARLTQRG